MSLRMALSIFISGMTMTLLSLIFYFLSKKTLIIEWKRLVMSNL